MRINNNVTAMNTHRMYSNNNSNVTKSVAKLSSGYRINSAADDAAGLAISEKMRAQIRGLNMASKNSADAQSMVQTAEGALQETHNILQRMRELATQSSSDTNEQTIDRQALQQEFAQLQAEIDDIASKTRFNDQNLIDGSFQKNRMVLGSTTTATFTAQVNSISVERATAGTHTMTVTVNPPVAATPVAGQAPTVTEAYVKTGAYTGSTIAFTPAASAQHNGNIYSLSIVGSDEESMTFQLLDSDGKVVSEAKNVDASAFGTTMKSVNFDGVGKLDITLADDGTVTTADLAKGLSGTVTFSDTGKDSTVTPPVRGSITLTIDGSESVTLYKGDTVANFRNAGIAFDFTAISDADLLAAATPFGAATITIEVSQLNSASMVIQTGANQGDELSINIDAMSTSRLGINYSSIATRTNASKAITEVNDAVNAVSTQRAALGALSNRLDHKIANLDTSAENLQAAESRIRDVDMAKEMTNFTKNNILAQASTAMLAQANALPQGVLQLLG